MTLDGPDQQIMEERLARMGVFQELTVALVELFDPAKDLDGFLERLAARLGCCAALCLHRGVEPDATLQLLGAAGLSAESRVLTLPAPPLEDSVVSAAPVRWSNVSLPYPELSGGPKGCWSFPLEPRSVDEESPPAALLLFFDGEPRLQGPYRGLVERLSRMLATVLFHRDLYQRTVHAEQLLRQYSEALEEQVQVRTADLQRANEDLAHKMNELVSTRDQLVQAEKLAGLGELAAGIAHELNNPLGGILGYAQVLARDAQGEELRSDLQAIEELARRCSRIVRSLLLMARRSSHEQTRIDPATLVQAALDLYCGPLKALGIAVRTEIADGLPAILGDEQMLLQVLANLLSNAQYAIQRTGRPGGIAVEVRSMDDKVMIAVEDDGPGIAPEHLKRIFDPFFTTKPVGEGTGLGLSLVHGIIQQCGGTLAAQSELGKGARFEVLLPRAPSGAASEAAKSGEAPPPPARPARILVIDDEPAFTSLLARILAKDGHRVDAARSGEAGIARASQGRYDLVFCDMRMPDMDGIEVCRRLRQLDACYTSRVIFCTGDVLDPRIQAFLAEHDAEQAGTVGRLAKPFERDEVLRLARTALRRSACAASPG